jgi:hypothetical protein
VNFSGKTAAQTSPPYTVTESIFSPRWRFEQEHNFPESDEFSLPFKVETRGWVAAAAAAAASLVVISLFYMGDFLHAI